MEWYERIKARRIELNMTQDELAKKIGYSTRSSINKIEQGLNDIPQSKINDFAKALNTTPIWLLFGYDEQNDIITDLYNKLDDLDKAEIRGEIKHMLKADKYTAADAEPNELVKNVIQSAIKDSMQIKNNVNR